MRVEIAIPGSPGSPGSKDERSSELKRIPSEFVLTVPQACGPRSRPAIERKQEFPEGSLSKPCRAERHALLVDQEGELDSGLRPERDRVVATAQSDGRDAGSGVGDFPLMVAQPGDVLAAEYSAVVTQERDDSRAGPPETAEAHGGAGVIGQFDGGECLRDRGRHAPSLARKPGHPGPDRSY